MYDIYYPISCALKTNVPNTFRILKKLDAYEKINKSRACEKLQVKILIGKTHSQFKNI